MVFIKEGFNLIVRQLPACTGAQLTGVYFCSFTFLFVPQDLKEKKLLEEKENGKDAATNGKVTQLPSIKCLAFLNIRNLWQFRWMSASLSFFWF